jgi:MtrB/PioB family decaheme-associated outer membrane protein
MKTRTSLLICFFTTSGLVSNTALAQESNTAVEEEPLVPEAFISEPVYSEIELGIGYVTDDAYKFGRYNGLQTEGWFVIGDIDTEKFSEDGRFWSIHGTNLGLESRYLRLEGGRQGSYKFFLEWDELPNYKNNTVKTPFLGVGGTDLTLPPGFDITTNLDANLNGFELKTKRERVTGGVIVTPKERWQFDVDFTHENKQGIDAVGGAIGGGGATIVGNTTTALLPEPIDYDTDQVNAKLHYAGDTGQLDLTYHASLFNNANESLSWQDPFNPATGAGSMSLAPDNEFHQLSLTGGYNLPYRSRLTAMIAMGRMTQNQNFEPYTINSAITTTPLPRSSLDGEVWMTNAQLKLASRPMTKLRVNAELRYTERDNQTPVETYNYVVLDSFTGTPVQNRPYSYKNNRINLDANYRFNAITSLRGGYKYDEMKRVYTDTERETTEEDTLFAKWKVKPHSTVDIALYGEVGNRDGSEYNPPTNQNPAMRKYNMADRDRTKVGASVDYMATEKLFLSARADYNQDDYNNSTLGLQEATQPTYTVDFSYQPRSNITTYGYYTHENIESTQANEDVTPSPVLGIWEADFDDSFDTVGLGAKLTGLGKWDVGADIVFSKATGNIEMRDLANPGTENQFPDTRTELTSVKLWTDYHYSKQLVYKIGYWYEEYSADNWAVDNLQAYNPTVDGILLLGNETLDYNTSVITVSASYRY